MSAGSPAESTLPVDPSSDCPPGFTEAERGPAGGFVGAPDATSRFVQVRGEVELVTEGAEDHLDELTRRYSHHPAYYGTIYPIEQRGRETRVICRIHARRVTLDAIHR